MLVTMPRALACLGFGAGLNYEDAEGHDEEIRDTEAKLNPGVKSRSGLSRLHLGKPKAI